MVVHQAPPSLGFSRQEHWSGLPFPSPMHESEKWKLTRSVMSDSVRPHRWQPSGLRHPWNSPGKNTGVGCHFLLQCMKVKSESEFARSCPTLRDPLDCSLPGSSVHGIFKTRVLEWGAIFCLALGKTFLCPLAHCIPKKLGKSLNFRINLSSFVF